MWIEVIWQTSTQLPLDEDSDCDFFLFLHYFSRLEGNNEVIKQQHNYFSCSTQTVEILSNCCTGQKYRKTQKDETEWKVLTSTCWTQQQLNNLTYISQAQSSLMKKWKAKSPICVPLILTLILRDWFYSGQSAYFLGCFNANAGPYFYFWFKVILPFLHTHTLDLLF